MATKVTYVSVLDKVVEGVALTSEEIEKVVALRDSIAKRNATKSTKPTKTQVENANLAKEILTAMDKGVSYSIADLRHDVISIADMSSQKIAPLMKTLIEQGKVASETIKGKIYYHLV